MRPSGKLLDFDEQCIIEGISNKDIGYIVYMVNNRFNVPNYVTGIILYTIENKGLEPTSFNGDILLIAMENPIMVTFQHKLYSKWKYNYWIPRGTSIHITGFDKNFRYLVEPGKVYINPYKIQRVIRNDARLLVVKLN